MFQGACWPIGHPFVDMNNSFFTAGLLSHTSGTRTMNLCLPGFWAPLHKVSGRSALYMSAMVISKSMLHPWSKSPSADDHDPQTGNPHRLLRWSAAVPPQHNSPSMLLPGTHISASGLGAGLLLISRHHWGVGGVGWGGAPPSPWTHPAPPPQRLGQIFFQAFRQSKIFSSALGAN